MKCKRMKNRRVFVLMVFVGMLYAPSSFATEPQAVEKTDEQAVEKTDEQAEEKTDDKVEMVEEVQIVEPQKDGKISSPNVQRTERAINILTARTTRKGSMLLVIDHRAYETFISSDAFFDYLGLDAGTLRIGIALRYGILDNLDAGLYRLNNGINNFDIYEWDARYAFLNQKKHFVDASIRGGISWFIVPDADDNAGMWAQLAVNRVFWDSLLVGTGFAVHSYSVEDKKTSADTNASGAILGFVEWRIAKKFAIDGEIAASVVGYRAKWPVFGFSAKILTANHSFSLVVSNSQNMDASGIVANSWRGFDNVVFGFQIVRQFNFIK
jgi:hypothetical protein